jgi:hypothetical protein
VGAIPTKDDGFLRAIKIRSTPCFGGEVKPSALSRHFYHRHHHHVAVKELGRLLTPSDLTHSEVLPEWSSLVPFAFWGVAFNHPDNLLRGI